MSQRVHRYVYVCTILFFLLLVASRSGPLLGAEGEEGTLAEGFRSPPAAAMPSAYWLWLNGYVNRDFLEEELRQFKQAGLSGVLIFDMGARGKKSAAPPAGPAFMSESSIEAIGQAVRIAGKLGLEVELSVSSSWDMGGSWVEPKHASKGLFTSSLDVEGPRRWKGVLPMPPIPAKAPRDEEGHLRFFQEVAVLAVPAGAPLAGHDFIFQLDPPGEHRLDRAVLYNTPSDKPKEYGPKHLFAKEFSIAVSTTDPSPSSFNTIHSGELAPTTDAQTFELPDVKARYVRLRLGKGHQTASDRIQLGEFELYNQQGVNVVASHVADRSRDGAVRIGRVSQRGQDKYWTAANLHDGSKSGAAGSWSSQDWPLKIGRPEEIVDLTDRVDDRGHLEWEIPEGKWRILRFACANTGERLKVPSPQSDGLATDHLSREATRTFLQKEIDALRNELGPLEKTALKELYLASYEVRGSIWTDDFLRQFSHYRGYDMKPYLPALLGNVVIDETMTRRFLYDYRKTLGDLLVDAYYRTAVETAHRAGVAIESEAGGPGPPIHQVPVDALKALGTIDSIRGEFWPKRPDADRLWVVKETACAGHIYNKPQVHMEAFTSMHHWQDGPFDLKPSADRAFCEGANHMVWHTAAHLPPEAGKPGWVYGAGTHLNRQLIWWPRASAFLDYLGRCSYLLQQGSFVADVCFYYGDQGYNFVPPKHVPESLGPGYDYDVINRDVILRRLDVDGGRWTLPHGQSYRLLSLPDREDIDLEVLEKLASLVRKGGILVGPKPTRSNGLTEYPSRDQEVEAIADGLWGPCDGRKVTRHRYGKGAVYWGPSLRSLLERDGIGPDVTCEKPESVDALDFIHRRTDRAEIYFVRNRTAEPLSASAIFRVTDRSPEIWDPATGSISSVLLFQRETTGTRLPLHLAPHGSVFVVFRKKASPREEMRLAQPDKVPGFLPVETALAPDGRIRVTTFHEGTYRLQHRDETIAQWTAAPLPAAKILEGRWNVSFEAPYSPVPEPIVMETLTAWNELEDPAIRYFSGTGRYTITFSLPEDWLGRDRRVYLDLGRLEKLGSVQVNDRSLGVLWKPPYRIDVTDALKPGANKLSVAVWNTWSNRLVGDALLSEDQHVTRTNITSSGKGAWKDTPLLPSGLLGPVRLIPARSQSIRQY